jgi:hypothetical protein
MNTNTGIRRLKQTTVALALALAALGSGAAMGATSQPSGDDDWRGALSVRSEALNRLDLTATFRTHAPEQPWERALRLRSEGLNLVYGL